MIILNKNHIFKNNTNFLFFCIKNSVFVKNIIMKIANFDKVFYEEKILDYETGKKLKEKYSSLEWEKIDSHNKIEALSHSTNADFAKLKQHLVLGVRKTHKYKPNYKVSNFLVPWTSSGCTAMCMYCYLVCNYNKFSYLRVFANREEMFEKLVKVDKESEKQLCFEIGSNSDLLLENEVTGNLEWTIEKWAREGKGYLTFPTKFGFVDKLLNLDHRGKTIFRISLNSQEIITKTEFLTSNLKERIEAVNKMAEAGYPVGILIAPIILLDNYKKLYAELIEIMANNLSDKVKKNGFLEIILMTYSYISNQINLEAFKNAIPLLDKSLMKSRGYGKYCYKDYIRKEAEDFLNVEIGKKLKMKILYFS